MNDFKKDADIVWPVPTPNPSQLALEVMQGIFMFNDNRPLIVSRIEAALARYGAQREEAERERCVSICRFHGWEAAANALLETLP